MFSNWPSFLGWQINPGNTVKMRSTGFVGFATMIYSSGCWVTDTRSALDMSEWHMVPWTDLEKIR